MYDHGKLAIEHYKPITTRYDLMLQIIKRLHQIRFIRHFAMDRSFETGFPRTCLAK